MIAAPQMVPACRTLQATCFAKSGYGHGWKFTIHNCSEQGKGVRAVMDTRAPLVGRCVYITNRGRRFFQPRIDTAA
jgi:hypothetical protein